jgi:hypothetical protein
VVRNFQIVAFDALSSEVTADVGLDTDDVLFLGRWASVPAEEAPDFEASFVIRAATASLISHINCFVSV